MEGGPSSSFGSNNAAPSSGKRDARSNRSSVAAPVRPPVVADGSVLRRSRVSSLARIGLAIGIFIGVTTLASVRFNRVGLVRSSKDTLEQPQHALVSEVDSPEVDTEGESQFIERHADGNLLLDQESKEHGGATGGVKEIAATLSADPVVLPDTESVKESTRTSESPNSPFRGVSKGVAPSTRRQYEEAAAAEKTKIEAAAARDRADKPAVLPEGELPPVKIASPNKYRFPAGDVLDYGTKLLLEAANNKDLPETDLDYTVTNFYHERDGKPGKLIPWLKGVKLAEPHRETTFKVTNPREGYEYFWEIKDVDDRSVVVASATGAEVKMTFTKLDLNVVSLMEVDPETKLGVRELTDTVMVKYVRREIRSLHEDEKEELLDAMVTLWKVQVKDGEGKELYGEGYQDIWAINRLHFKAGGASTCDHFHAGLGFLVAHSMLSNTFEASLQAVNPKLTLPYWDFTIETSSTGGHLGQQEPQRFSPMLTPEYFGDVDEEDHMVKTSRWAFTEVPNVEVNNPGNLEADVYSKLRSPWNVNNRPYLTRGMGNMCGVRVEGKHPWPTCLHHYELSTENASLYTWVWGSMQHPHGGVHAWLGGVLDCEEMHNDYVKWVGEDLALQLAYYGFIHRKYLYRSGIFKCSEPADADLTAQQLMESGQCGCLDYDLENGDDYLQISEVLGLRETLGDFDDNTHRRVIHTICTRTLSEGDHLQSSSSLDPSFWPTHPTMERLWMFKRLTGTLTDLTWPDTDIKFHTSNGTTESWRLSLWEEDCNGHRGSDVFPFDLTDAGSSFKVQTGIRGFEEGGNSISNRDLVKLLDPRINSMNYIYDNFEWKHCEADGINLDDTWNSLPNPEVVLWYQ